jgi:hypothetical protein
VPAKQEVQAAALDAPVVAEKVPAGQGMHALPPEVAE